MQSFFLVALAGLAMALPNALVQRAIQSCGNSNTVQCCTGITRRDAFNGGLGGFAAGLGFSGTGASSTFANCALSSGQVCGVNNVFCCAGTQTGLINIDNSCNSINVGSGADTSGVVTLEAGLVETINELLSNL